MQEEWEVDENIDIIGLTAQQTQRGTWEIFKEQGFYIYGVSVVLLLISLLPGIYTSILGYRTEINVMAGLETIPYQAITSETFVFNFFVGIISSVVTVFVLRSIIEKILFPDYPIGQASVYSTPLGTWSRTFLSLTGVNIIMGLLTSIISSVLAFVIFESAGIIVWMFMVVPVVVIMGMITLAAQYIQAVTPGLGVMDTLGQSVNVVKSQIFKLLGTSMISALILLSGAYLFVIGLIITIPLAAIYLTKHVLICLSKEGIYYQEIV